MFLRRISPQHCRRGRASAERIRPVPALVILATVVSFSASPAIAQTIPPESWKFQPVNQPQHLRAESQTALLSTDERERIANLIRSNAAAAQNTPAPQNNGPVVHVSNAAITALVLNVEFTSEAARQNFHVNGATIFAAVGPFAEMFVKPTDEVIDALVNVPGIRRVEPENPIRLPPPPVRAAGVASRGIAEQIVSGGLNGLTGKGVIFTIVDSGLDFRNPDFLDTSGGGPPRSRLLYFWDTLSDAFETKGLGTRAPIDYPNGQPIGTLYTRAQLNADLRLPVGQGKIPSPDENGHGTAAASIAVGNGFNSPPDDKHIGVAPQADIIAVRIGDAEGSMPEGFLLNAIVEWVDKAAREAHEPVVISCSFGGHDSGHDGASVEERHLSARFAPEVVGRAIVISAGNERENAIHAKIKAAGKSTPGYLAWQAREGATLRLFFRAGDPKTFKPADFNYDPIRLFTDGPPGSSKSTPHPTLLHKVSSASFNAVTGEWSVKIVVGRGPGGLLLYTDSGQAVQGDAYFADMPAGGAFLDSLTGPLGPQSIAFHGEQITTPGTAANAITVGSYDWNDQFDGQTKATCKNAPIDLGALSCYSNPGYDRVSTFPPGPAVVKPEIVAPGQVFTAAYAHLTDGRPLNEVLLKDNGEPYWQVDHSGRWVLFDGTSASAPYVAGVIALMMQKKPGITAGEIKNLLRKHASADTEFTGTLPNPSWGYGKLDIAAVKATLNDLR
jgi:minor extracellular serine protease Vpr